MQADTHTSVTWVTFSIEAVKILGPAVLALTGSWLALRFQQKGKQAEILGQTKLKARELMFESYQKTFDIEVAELKDLAKAAKSLSLSFLHGNTQEKGDAIGKIYEALSGAAMPLLFGLDRVEEDLKQFGLHERYKEELAFIKELNDEEATGENEEEIAQIFDKVFTAVAYYIVINRDVIARKREQLFREYLPGARAG